LGSRNRALAQLGSYVFVAKLGRGAMAEIFLTVTRSIGSSKLLVLKAILPELADDPEFVDMFLDEARLAAKLNHPHVVQTVEVGQIEGSYFLTMEYLDGRSLAEICRRAELAAVDLSLAFHLTVVSQTLAALQYAHELADYDGTPLKIVHRDVTPANIFVTFDGTTKLVDFGIAKAARRQTKTRLGVVKGKQAYLSPEQLLQEDTDHRADLYSLGVVLWELLAEKPLWPDDSSSGALRLMRAAPRLRSVVPDIDEGLDAICARALATTPDDRYPSAAAMLEAVESVMERLSAGPLGGRDLAQTMKELFHEDREAFDKVVRLKVNGLLEDDATMVRPAAPLPYAEGQDHIPFDDASHAMTTAMPTAPSAYADEPIADVPALVALQTAGVVTSGSTAPGPYQVSESSAPTAHRYPAAATPSADVDRPAEVAIDDRPERSTSAPMMAVAGGMVGAAALAIVMLLASQWPASAPPTPAAPSAPPPPVAFTSEAAAPAVPVVEPLPVAASAAPATPRGEYVELSLSATPPQAHFILDGARLEGNPFLGRFPRDDAYHQLRVFAPGCVPRYEALRFDRDVKRQLVLQRSIPAAPRTAPGFTPPRDAGTGVGPGRMPL
jgi:eukaryotic-like serine/threonine-protein kinase